jgi:hypothetical protein
VNIFRACNRLLLLVGIFVVISTSAASSSQSNLTKAEQLEAAGNYEDAMQLLTPCLRKDSQLSANELEECLYRGEKVANLAIPKLIVTKPISFFEDRGIKLGDGHYSGLHYNHDFFRVLARKFPTSKYSEEFDFVLMNFENDSVADWKSDIASINRYLKKHPDGVYVKSAKLHLACIYEGLWELQRPDTDEEGYRDWAGLHPDKNLAIKYKRKAIQMYQSALYLPEKNSLGTDIFDIDRIIESLNYLEGHDKNSEHYSSNIGCIIND